MMEKVHVYMCLHIALNKSNPLLETKLGFFSVHASFLLARAFRNDYVAACSTALRSATENSEMGGNETVP